MEIRTRQAKTVCDCAHPAPDETTFCSVEDQRELALDYLSLTTSSPQRINWVIRELYDHRSGELYGFDGEIIDLDTTNHEGEHLLDWIFGADPGKSMNRLIERGKRVFVNTLDDDDALRLRHLLYFHAMQVHRCRTMGSCSEVTAPLT